MIPRVAPRVQRLAALATFAGVVVAAACVDIATGPSGVVSMRLVPVPPSIIAGDTLRDSTGAAVPVQAVAFDDRGAAIADAPLRYGALALQADTTEASRVVPIVVDSLTGATRALGGPNPLALRARVQVRVGDRLQALDTIEIVRRPTRLTRRLATDTTTPPPDTLALFYDCRSTGEALLNTTIPDSTFVVQQYRRMVTGDVIALPIRVLTSDSSGTRVPVRSFLVDYQIDSVNGKPASQIPTVTLPSGRKRPAIGLITRSSTPAGPPDNPIRFDTTDAAGATAPRIRIFPSALGPSSVFPDTIIRVVVSARARTSTTTAIADTSRTRVVLRRFTRNPLDGTALACPAS